LAMVDAHDPQLASAHQLLLIPDLLNHFLCGSNVGEYTNATTTQCLDALKKDWARGMLAELGIPTRVLPDIVEPGAVLGTLEDQSVKVIAPGTHDTASAVAGIPLQESEAYLSSGTWSLLGVEVDRPVLSEQARSANLTNEGGVGGKTRLLKNVMGLWLIQQARIALGAATYDQLTAEAEHATA